MSKYNPTSIQFSLRKFIEDETGVDAYWVEDGVKLPDEKPFITVEQLFDTTEILTKGRQAVQTLFYYQIGIRAESLIDRQILQGDLQRLFLFEKIPYINAFTQETDGHLRVEANDGTPIPAEDISDKSNYHRYEFDVTVDVVYGRNR